MYTPMSQYSVGLSKGEHHTINFRPGIVARACNPRTRETQVLGDSVKVVLNSQGGHDPQVENHSPEPSQTGPPTGDQGFKCQ
ncbi:hypothetical protein LEMLEM_LOCUS24632, partial [Lemmus lemmus]